MTGPGVELDTGQVRVLTASDLSSVVKVLLRRPVENAFVAARIRGGGLEQFSLGCPVWGYENHNGLTAVCHAGANLVPVGADSDIILDAFARFAGPTRMSSSIFGPAEATLGLWRRLCERWGSQWSTPREVRPHQPLMAIAGPPQVEAHPGVRRITLDHWDTYFEAAVRMYTEEVGVSPLRDGSTGYRFYVRQLITSGRAYGVIENGAVLFKADLGSVAGGVSQVQGVWLDPSLRGRGMAPACMAGVVEQARVTTPTVSLYVNDFNAPALATYHRVGFAQVGEFATVLF
jgi:predicted GNAT family acetyltransferase